MMRQLFFIVLALAVLAQIAHGDSACQKERKDALQKNMKGVVGNFIPRCDSNGDYKMAQCNGSTGYCYCVDPKTGKQKGEAKRGGVKCNS
ncbi:hypothetical protein AVEN_54077-1 [Araneus ventricosus]|uniref:Thyroglobulin type-1 domain-containing protein n=1 Tax=Araneus ventricosus TaxID=182803 RepID=A0A4Y2ICN4_ARAVE|nr:hypothetical protein AVEN_54077-1 [Araneus ventricosus]